MDPHPNSVLILGATGFLGRRLMRAALASNWRPLGAARRVPPGRAGGQVLALDIGDPEALGRILDRHRPRALINAAAMARAAACREDPPAAMGTNAEGAGIAAGLAAERDIRFVQVSTDLVFGAGRPAGERYREEDPPAPLDAYGASKARGEGLVLAAHPSAVVARLPLLYGASGGGGEGASDGMLAAIAEGERPVLFRDEWRTPLDAGDAALALLELAGNQCSGYLHVGGPERLSRVELGLLVLLSRGHTPDAALALITEGVRADVSASAPRAEDVSLDSGRALRLLRTRLRAPALALSSSPQAS